MKISIRKLCSFTGLPEGDILKAQPKPVNRVVVAFNTQSECSTSVFHASVDSEMGCENVWAVTFEFAGGKKFCRLFWRKRGKKQWKQTDYKHLDVKLAVEHLTRVRMEKLVSRVMSE